MNQNTNCSGVVCPMCEHFPTKCQGCATIEGKLFWLKFTREFVASIIVVLKINASITAGNVTIYLAAFTTV